MFVKTIKTNLDAESLKAVEQMTDYMHKMNILRYQPSNNLPICQVIIINDLIFVIYCN
jgi:hypothetical protein